MILLKANDQLKRVFLSLIKTLGVNVIWNHIFVITNNTLILPGKVRSLFFNYDTKQLYTNLIDLTIEESQITEIINDELLVNTLNMTLYAFGKWGTINGLKVEKDYSQLNQLFKSILKEVHIEPSFRDDNFRFYKNKILISYEDVIHDILTLSEPISDSSEKEASSDVSFPSNQDTTESENTSEQTIGNRWKSPTLDEDLDDEYKLGLWHNMKWVKRTLSFAKTEHIEDKNTTRLGNSFYPVDYLCPSCKEKLFISLYPVGREFPIETEEGKVYLARAYTCNHCNCFYTPRPDKLLQEGDIYILEFEEDRIAYEDYLELLGNAGERCANYKFNEFEAQHNRRNEKTPETLEELFQHIDTASEEELNSLEEKMISGFYPKTAVEVYYPKLVKKRLQKNAVQHTNKPFAKEKPNKTKKEKLTQKTETPQKSSRAINLHQDFSKKTPDELKYLLSELEGGDEETSSAIQEIKNQLNNKLKEKYDAHIAVVTRMSPKQLTDLKSKIESEQTLPDSEKEPYLKEINKILFEEKEKSLKQKAEACKGKSYHEIERVVHEINESDVPQSVKQPLLEFLTKQKKITGEKEVEYLISTLPPQLNKKQFEQFLSKLHQYKDVDITPYEKQLEQRRSLVEQQEINSFIARANKNNRDSLFQLYNDLKEQGFSKKNLQPFLDKIHNKIYEMDQIAIQKICPSITDMTFEEGLEAIKKIENGVFLPELKINALEMLDKRLTKLKADECDQLVRKLKREMNPYIKDNPKFHFYEARKAMRGDLEDEEKAFFDKVLNGYASAHGQYEYPVFVSDSSRFSNGKEGFVLTPDHIFYNSLFHSGIIPILEIDTIEEKTGLINKGIFVEKINGERIKLPLSLPSKEWKWFSKVLGDFIDYLQEKPQSRNISYLAKEKHEKKCCYRCGYIYTDGDICPKCGSKANQ
ncbi:coiled-coil domain-containing protein [Velocimicrobium porci]|uniref:Uncharacterized protein n=1 Tax=Velocimicrobium porci TaxID=2606634 RepID=A0A6L5Y0R5_9FIRM|nr:hypothetical protein [Velocimicrobium porci]MSS64534.1 hypothetical protein [Velocimicrobium porci]